MKRSFVINPTGGAVRMDRQGGGGWGAPRGSRLHTGVDRLCMPGQPVLAPIDGVIIRRSRPYTRKRLGSEFDHPANNGLLLEGYAIDADRMDGHGDGDVMIRIFLWYCTLLEGIGTDVTSGGVIAIAASVGDLYQRAFNITGVKDHIHLAIRLAEKPRTRIEPRIQELASLWNQ